MKIKEKQVKSIITKSNLPGVDLVINPYVGCQHACVYCYADFMKRFTGHNQETWGDFVDVKINAPNTIKKINKNSFILFGSVTDPYQSVEAKYKITRKCLEKLLSFQPKIEILTKSPLILKDIELLKKFKDLKVGISIGILDEDYARQLEPCVVSPRQRLDVLKQLKEEGIEVFLFMSPIFPEISEVIKLIELSKDYVDEILFESINIRINNRKRILDFIEKNKSELKEFYENLPKNKNYWEKIKREIIKKCKELGVKYRIYFHHSK